MNKITHDQMMLLPSSLLRCWYTRSKYLRIYANPLFLAISNLIGIFMSVVDETLTSMRPQFSTIRVAVSNISPLTFPLTSSLLRSLTQMFQCSFSFLKVYRTQQKSLDDIINTFLQHRQIILASPQGVSKIFLNYSMFGSNFFCSSKSLEMDSQVWWSVGKVKKYLKVLSLPYWQQCSLRGQAVSGCALHASSGTSKMLANCASLSLNSSKQGCSSPIILVNDCTCSVYSYFLRWVLVSLLFSLLSSRKLDNLLATEVAVGYARQSLSILGWRCSSSICSLVFMNWWCSSFTSAQLTLFLVMRQEQRHRIADSQIPCILQPSYIFNQATNCKIQVIGRPQKTNSMLYENFKEKWKFHPLNKNDSQPVSPLFADLPFFKGQLVRACSLFKIKCTIYSIKPNRWIQNCLT